MALAVFDGFGGGVFDLLGRAVGEQLTDVNTANKDELGIASVEIGDVHAGGDFDGIEGIDAGGDEIVHDLVQITIGMEENLYAIAVISVDDAG